ncbi:MAG: hypothetical protein ACFE96_16335 [Candidatus Hermodarchaeota archaeon]
MIDLKKWLWLFPFIGGFIVIISFMFPAAFFFESTPSYSTEFFRWMLDFYYSHTYSGGIHTYTIHQSTSLTGWISIISSSFVILSNIFILITANRYRKGNFNPKYYCLIVALLTISITIGWMIMKEITTLNSFDHSFWGLLSPHFGIIGPFIGAGLEITGFLLLRKQREQSI